MDAKEQKLQQLFDQLEKCDRETQREEVARLEREITQLLESESNTTALGSSNQQEDAQRRKPESPYVGMAEFRASLQKTPPTDRKERPYVELPPSKPIKESPYSDMIPLQTKLGLTQRPNSPSLSPKPPSSPQANKKEYAKMPSMQQILEAQQKRATTVNQTLKGQSFMYTSLEAPPSSKLTTKSMYSTPNEQNKHTSPYESIKALNLTPPKNSNAESVLSPPSSSPSIAAKHNSYPERSSTPTLSLRDSNDLPARVGKSTTPTSTIIDTSDLSLPNLEGYLEKKPDVGVIKAWRRRFFLLREDKLIYFRDDEARKNENLLGFIPLKEATAIVAVNNTTQSTRFEINTKGRIWHLRAGSIEERDKWIQACQQHAAYTEGEKETIPTRTFLSDKDMTEKTGYLEVLRGKTWHNRWFVVRHGIIYKHKTKDDPRPKKFPLFRCYLEEYNPEEQSEFSSFKLGLGNKVWILRSANPDEMHEWLNAIVRQKCVVERAVTKSTFFREGGTIRENS